MCISNTASDLMWSEHALKGAAVVYCRQFENKNFSGRIFTFPPQPSAGVSPMGSSPLQRPDTFHNQVRWGLNNLITLHPNEYSLPNGKESQTHPEKKYFQTQEANHWGFGGQRRQTWWSMRRASVFSFWHSTNFHRVILHNDYWSYLLWHNCHTNTMRQISSAPMRFSSDLYQNSLAS